MNLFTFHLSTHCGRWTPWEILMPLRQLTILGVMQQGMQLSPKLFNVLCGWVARCWAQERCCDLGFTSQKVDDRHDMTQVLWQQKNHIRAQARDDEWGLCIAGTSLYERLVHHWQHYTTYCILSFVRLCLHSTITLPEPVLQQPFTILISLFFDEAQVIYVTLITYSFISPNILELNILFPDLFWLLFIHVKWHT